VDSPIGRRRGVTGEQKSQHSPEPSPGTKGGGADSRKGNSERKGIEGTEVNRPGGMYVRTKGEGSGSI